MKICVWIDNLYTTGGTYNGVCEVEDIIDIIKGIGYEQRIIIYKELGLEITNILLSQNSEIKKL